VIPGYSDLLIEELPGIAAKALGYLRDVIGGGFKDDGDIAQGQEDFEREIDQVRQWVDECTEPAATAVEERSAAYKSYRLWADSTGVSRLKASEFFVRLTAAGFPAGKVHGGTRVHRGLVITQFRVQGALAMTSAHDDEPSDPFAGASEERADA
jgi:phage/plasmid-associated DNA primase